MKTAFLAHFLISTQLFEKCLKLIMHTTFQDDFWSFSHTSFIFDFLILWLQKNSLDFGGVVTNSKWFLNLLLFKSQESVKFLLKIWDSLWKSIVNLRAFSSNIKLQKLKKVSENAHFAKIAKNFTSFESCLELTSQTRIWSLIFSHDYFSSFKHDQRG